MRQAGEEQARSVLVSPDPEWGHFPGCWGSQEFITLFLNSLLKKR